MELYEIGIVENIRELNYTRKIKKIFLPELNVSITPFSLKNGTAKKLIFLLQHLK